MMFDGLIMVSLWVAYGFLLFEGSIVVLSWTLCGSRGLFSMHLVVFGVQIVQPCPTCFNPAKMKGQRFQDPARTKNTFTNTSSGKLSLFTI